LSAGSEVERLRKRLSRMTDAELLRFVDAARVLCEGKNPSKSYTGRRTKNGAQKVLYLAGVPLTVLREQVKNRNGEFVPQRGPRNQLRRGALSLPSRLCCGQRFFGIQGFEVHRCGRRFTSSRLARSEKDVCSPRPSCRCSGQRDYEHSCWKTHAMLLRYLGEAKADAQRSAFARME